MPDITLHAELGMPVKVGLTPSEALQIATRTSVERGS